MEGLAGIKKSNINRAVVLNPGQGHVPVALWKLLEPQKIVLVDRDLLSLRYSRKNLISNGCPENNIDINHQVDINTDAGEQTDLVAGIIREGEGKEAVELIMRQAAGQLSPDELVIVVSSSTAVTRLVSTVQKEKVLKVKDRIKKRGYSRLVLIQRER